jgi:hypothetical protein
VYSFFVHAGVVVLSSNIVRRPTTHSK